MSIYESYITDFGMIGYDNHSSEKIVLVYDRKFREREHLAKLAFQSKYFNEHNLCKHKDSKHVFFSLSCSFSAECFLINIFDT